MTILSGGRLCLLFVLLLLMSQWILAESKYVKSPQVTESVTTSARCITGHVMNGSYRASHADVEVITAIETDCNAQGQCQVWQVTARRPNGKAFDIEATVTCTEAAMERPQCTETAHGECVEAIERINQLLDSLKQDGRVTP